MGLLDKEDIQGYKESRDILALLVHLALQDVPVKYSVCC